MKLHELAPPWVPPRQESAKGAAGHRQWQDGCRGHKVCWPVRAAEYAPDLRELDASCQASSEARFCQ